jgi:hypothetical protein
MRIFRMGAVCALGVIASSPAAAAVQSADGTSTVAAMAAFALTIVVAIGLGMKSPRREKAVARPLPRPSRMPANPVDVRPSAEIIDFNAMRRQS